MNRFSVMDGHCDTVYRCWAMGEELPYNTGALELGSALDTLGAMPRCLPCGRLRATWGADAPKQPAKAS